MTSKHDRRGFLRAVASVPIAAVLPATATSTDPADFALLDWMTRIAAYNTGRVKPADDSDPEDAVWLAYVEHPEERINALPTSAAAIAALVLVEISYEHETDAVDRQAPLFRILRFLTPSLTGFVAQIAGDVLMHEGRPLRGTLLARGLRGREVMPWAA